jgi:hypothetical protein
MINPEYVHVVLLMQDRIIFLLSTPGKDLLI